MSEKPKKSTGAGSKISFSTDGTSYTEFGSVSKASSPSFKRGTVDVSDLNTYNANNQMKENLPSWIEAEEMSLEGFFLKDDTAQAAAETAFWSGADAYIKIVLPAVIGKTFIFHGTITSYQTLDTIDPDTGLGYKLGLTIVEKPSVANTTTGDGG